MAVFILITTVTACRDNSVQRQGGGTPTDSLINSGGGIADSAYVHGARLVAANDCLTCHKLEEQSIGPSYYRISEHYEFTNGAVENLAHSIINGSKGLWGSNQMTPHPNVSFPDAKAMATYILSLKKTPKTESNG